MRYLLLITLTLSVIGLAGADHWPTSNIAPDKGTYVGDGATDGREGGETFADAVVIASLPYTDSGATCDNINDVDPSCVYMGGPDVFYVFTATANELVTVSLCGSAYDTGLAVYDAGYAEIYCNDDFCGLQSQLDFPATAGQTYYIGVDAYGSDCGSYTLNVTSAGGACDPSCPDGALLEGEPDCYDGYEDHTNGGCNSDPQIWGLICPQDGEHAVLCGTSGNYNGDTTRDTDWFRCYGTGGEMTATVCADFPVQLIFIYGLDCNNPVYDIITGSPLQEVSLTRTVAMGDEAWIWVGTQTFGGTPCGAPYLLTMDGIYAGADCDAVAVDEKTWGNIKTDYK